MMRTVLVNEDDPNILFAVSTLLEGEGYAVVCAENGAVALELLAEMQMPDLILLDRIMPVMTGCEFAEEFRARYGRKIPLIMMTAAGDLMQRAAGIDAQGWIAKPFSLEDLLSLIQKNLPFDAPPFLGAGSGIPKRSSSLFSA